MSCLGDRHRLSLASKVCLPLAEGTSISWHMVPSSHPRTQQVTLLEGGALLRGHDDLALEPVLPPQDAHLLNGHPLGLRQEAQGVHSHAEHPEGKEDVGAVLQAAQTTLDDRGKIGAKARLVS